METSARADEIRYGPWVMSGHPIWGKPGDWLSERMLGERPQKSTKPARIGGLVPVHSAWLHKDIIRVELVTSRETGSLFVDHVTMTGRVSKRHLNDLAVYLDRMAARAHADAYGHPEEAKPMVDSRHTRLTDEFLTQVAEVYRMGGTQGRKLVADHYNARSTADKWLAKARASGILGPAPARGRAGSVERKQR